MIALCAILLLAPDSRGQTVTRKKYTISGSVGLAGVALNGFTMNGAPVPVVTDQNGAYIVQVEHGWSGTVTPVLKGYKFTPASKTYPKVVGPLSPEDYKATLVTFTITGSVMQPDVKMVGFPEEVTSDPTGRYTAVVPSGFSGKVTPGKPAWQFEPSVKSYTSVAKDMKEENYKASEQMIVISGTAGVEGAVLSGFLGNPVVSGPQGAYRAVVKYGWTGKVTPTKEGHEFTPSDRDYAALTDNQANQDYAAKVFSYQISGTAGIAGVVMKGLPGEPMTDGNGFYTATVTHGLSVKITPDKPGYIFTPKTIELTKVAAPKENQDFVGKVNYYTISGNVGTTPGVAMSGLPSDPVSNDKGQYTAQVEYGWTGTVMPKKDGFLFTPASKDYAAVTQNQTLDYKAQGITFKISGNVGQAQAIVKVVPGAASVISGPTGDYSVEVPYNWKGTITPQKGGFGFDPNTKPYDGVLSPQVNQDFTPKIMQYSLSGRVTDETNNGVEGVTVFGDNDGGSATTDAQGQFELKVSYGWKGKLTFSKDGYTFNPPAKPFIEAVGADVKNMVVAAKVKMLTITDRIMAGAEPVAEVKITAAPGSIPPVMTDNKGVYKIQVPYGWTGEVKFEKEGFDFDPPSKPFTSVTEDIDTFGKKPVTPPPVNVPPVNPKPVQPTPVQPTPVQPTPVQPTPPVRNEQLIQQLQQQLAQANQEQNTVTSQINALKAKGQQVPAQLTQKFNDVQARINNLMTQLNKERSAAPTTPDNTTPAPDGLITKQPGDRFPSPTPKPGLIVPNLTGAPTLLNVLADLASKTGVKIIPDATVKPDPVPISLSTVEGLPITSALQTILTSFQEPYMYRALDDRTFEVYRPISNSFPGVDLVQALQDISAVAQVPIVSDPNVTGQVNVTFVNASLEEALGLMLAGKPLVFKKTAHYYLVADRGMTGRNFPEISETHRVRLNYTQPARVKSLLSPVFAQYVQAELPNPRDPNDQGNMLLVTAAPTIAERIMEDIKKIDRYKRQVLLDARVVSMEKGNLLNLGAEWSWPTMQAGIFKDGSGKATNGTTGWASGVQIGYAPDATFTNSLMMALNLLEETSQADIIANPKVVAQDGRRAEMRVIQEEWFMMQATQQSNSFYQQAQLQKIESGTVLTITPYIGDNNDITLTMAVEVSDSIPKARGSELPLVTRRTAKNSVTVKDGGTVAVGGLTENHSKMDEKRVPGLSSIPLLGELFKNKNNDKSSREVAVFVTAHLVREGTQVSSKQSEPSSIATSEPASPDEFKQKLADSMHKSE
jgi:hypothetical protein